MMAIEWMDKNKCNESEDALVAFKKQSPNKRACTMVEVVEMGATDAEDPNREYTTPFSGVGVVPIHSIDLKGKITNTTQYLKTKLHTDPRHLQWGKYHQMHMT
jgi:hypothetical protein